jgi:hypothetical protein
MFRFILIIALLLQLVGISHADTFDRYTNSVLSKAVESPQVLSIDKLEPRQAARHNTLFEEAGAVLLIVKTNQGHNAKVLVQFARQRNQQETVPLALLERATSYKLGQERALQAFSATVHLYDGFQYSFDLGQVVPTSIGGDVCYRHTPEGGYLEAVGKARMYLVMKHPPGVEDVKTAGKSASGTAFDSTALSGKYKLYDDGRRTAELILAVGDDGKVTGNYTSEQSGREYELTGKVHPTVKHQLSFTVKFPNTMQEFTGFAFTKQADVICGSTRLQGQEFGFYALREK